MKRVLTVAELSTLRTRPAKVEYYLAVHKPKVVFAGLGSGLPSSHPNAALTTFNNSFANTTGARPGMTVKFGPALRGDEYGELRVRGHDGNNTLLLAEAGSGLINWKHGMHVTVYDDYRVWPIHHSYDTANSRWLVDLQNYSAQLSQYGPQVIMGPPDVLFLDGGKAVGQYVGNLSYSHTPGASITSQRWTFPGGVAVTSALGSSAAPVQVTYLNASPGGEYFSLSATDANGASHIGHRLLFVFGSGASAPVRCRFDQITGGLKTGGYRTRIFVAETANSNIYQDGAQVVIVERASYGGIASSIGGNFFARDSVVFAGRIMQESQRIEPFTEEVSFAIETIDGELRRTQAYDLFLESHSTASDWDMASGLTLDRTAIALSKYRSTIATVTDFNLAEGFAKTNEIPYRDLPAGNLWEQLNYNYQASFGLVAADMQGTLWAQLDVQVTGLSANLPTANAIAIQDQRDTITIEREHRDSNAMTRLYAVQGGTTIPLGAESPGNRDGYFGGRVEVSRNLTVPTQDILITWSGNARAKENNRLNRISVPLAGNYRYDAVPQSRFTMSLSPTDNIRALNLGAHNFLATETTIEYHEEGQYALGSVNLEAIVNGFGGSAITFPRITGFIPPATPNPVFDPPTWNDPPLTEAVISWHTYDVVGEAMGCCVHGDHVYTAGWTHESHNVSNRRIWRIEKRLLTTGELVWEREITTNTGSASSSTATNQAMDVWADDTNVYVIGWERYLVNSTRCRFDKLLASDGSTVWSDNSISTGAVNSIGVRITADTNRLYIVAHGPTGVQAWPSSGANVFARSLVDGTAIWDTSVDVGSTGFGYSDIESQGGILIGVGYSSANADGFIARLDPSSGAQTWLQRPLTYTAPARVSIEPDNPDSIFYTVSQGTGDYFAVRFGITTYNWRTDLELLGADGIANAVGDGLVYAGGGVNLRAFKKVGGQKAWSTNFTDIELNSIAFKEDATNRLLGGGQRTNTHFYTVCWVL